MATTKVRSDQMFPCFVGFWASVDQREKLESMAQHTHRKLGEVMRLLLDRAALDHVDVWLQPPPSTPITPASSAPHL